MRREIAELRIAAGNWATAADDYLLFCASNHLIDRLADNVWIKDLKTRFVIANQVTSGRLRIILTS